MPSWIRLPPPSAPHSSNKMSSSKMVVVRSQVACGISPRTPSKAWRMLSLPRSTPAGVMSMASSLKSATISSRSSAPSACTWWLKPSWGLRVAATWPLLSVPAAVSRARRSQQLSPPPTRARLGTSMALASKSRLARGDVPGPDRPGPPEPGGCRAGLAGRRQPARVSPASQGPRRGAPPPQAGRGAELLHEDCVLYPPWAQCRASSCPSSSTRHSRPDPTASRPPGGRPDRAARRRPPHPAGRHGRGGHVLLRPAAAPGAAAVANRPVSSAGPLLRDHGRRLGRRRAGAQGLQPLVGDPQYVLALRAAHTEEAAALAQEGEGVLQDLAVGSPALGGGGEQGGGLLQVAGGLGQGGPGGGGGQAVPGGGRFDGGDQVAGQGRGRGGGDAGHVGDVLAEEAVATGAVGGELGDLGDQGQGGGAVAGGLGDQGGVDQGGDELLEVLDLAGPGQHAAREVPGGDQVALPGE